MYLTLYLQHLGLWFTVYASCDIQSPSHIVDFIHLFDSLLAIQDITRVALDLRSIFGLQESMDSCAFSFLSSTYSLRNGTRLLRGIATSNDTSRLHFRVPGFKRTRFQHLVDQTRITNSKRCRSPTVATTGNSDLKNYSTPSKQVNIAFLVSGSGRSLQNFCEKLSTGELKKCNVSLVIASKSSAGAIQRAGSFGIPSRIVSPKDFAGNAEAFCEKISELLDKFEVQLVVMAGWMHFYQIPPRYFGRVINIHPSLIPSFCGQGYYGKRVHEAVVSYDFGT